jgi:Protein of unknown function (DUF1565)
MKIASIAAVALACALIAVVSSSAGSPAREASDSERKLPARASTFHVSTTGSDATGTGTRRRPWRTIAKACASVPRALGHTILVHAGTYDESATCSLPCRTSLKGRGGPSRTIVRGSADPLVVVRNCLGRSNEQEISGLRLDGQQRQAGVFGLRAIRTRGLTIRRLVIDGFRGPANAGGGAIDVYGAWDLDLGHSVLRNSGNANADACSGTLGVGEIHDSRIHDLAISEDRGYGVKTSTLGVPRQSRMSNVKFWNLSVHVAPDACARWNSLAFELYRVEAVNVVIRNSRLNRVLSLISDGPRLRRAHRYRIHHNLFDISSGSNYAIELGTHSAVVDHNYFSGGAYAVAAFSPTPKVGNTVHHNVFDNQTGPTAALHLPGGLRDARFYSNTVVLRQQSWRDGVFSFGSPGAQLEVKNNLFVSTHVIGDKLGPGIATNAIERNGFSNITPRGRSPVTADPLLPLSGGFPRAYVPPATSPAIDAGVEIRGVTDGHRGGAPDLGAFDRGAWTIGPR